MWLVCCRVKNSPQVQVQSSQLRVQSSASENSSHLRVAAAEVEQAKAERHERRKQQRLPKAATLQHLAQ
jgi:hypothetical protein